MVKAVFGLGAGLFWALSCAGPAGATDLEPQRLHRKPTHARHHREARLTLPGPVLSVIVLRGPTCGGRGGPYPNYAQASCRDHDGILTADDTRLPTGVSAYSFRAYYGLR